MIYKRGCEMDDFLEMVEEELLHQKKVLLKKKQTGFEKSCRGCAQMQSAKKRGPQSIG